MRGISGVDVVISNEREQVLETGGALAKAAPLLGEAPVFVVNTDAFWAPNDAAPLHALANAYFPSVMDEVLLLADKERCLGFSGAGDFFIDAKGALTHRGDEPTAPWAYAGLRIVNPQLYAAHKAEPLVSSARARASSLRKFAPGGMVRSLGAPDAKRPGLLMPRSISATFLRP